MGEEEGLRQYRAAIEEYAATGTNYLFHNKGNDHAIIIFENIFRNAKEIIRIAANELCNKEVADSYEYISALLFFLDKENTRLEILLTHVNKEEIPNHLFFHTLYKSKAYSEGRIIIRDGQGRSFRNIKGKPIHFCTADARMYRVEDDVENRRARCNFNDTVITPMLQRSFDSAFNSIEETVDLGEMLN